MGCREFVPGMRQGTRVSSKGCIVIVEPDDLIRVLVERWLDEAGFQAFPVFKDHALPVVMPQLVITDISDPDRAGDTISALRAT